VGVLLTVLAALATHALIRSNLPSAEERDAKAREARLHSDWPWLALYAGDNAAMESSHRPGEAGPGWDYAARHAPHGHHALSGGRDRPPTIQRISGHKTLVMVLRYAHVSGVHIDAAMAALDRTIPEPAARDENVA